MQCGFSTRQIILPGACGASRPLQPLPPRAGAPSPCSSRTRARPSSDVDQFETCGRQPVEILRIGSRQLGIVPDGRRRYHATHKRSTAAAGQVEKTRREGGLGVILAHGLTSSADYAYVFGRNRIRLKLA